MEKIMMTCVRDENRKGEQMLGALTVPVVSYLF